MSRQRRDLSNTMSKQGSKAAQKEKSPENKLKGIKICDINDNEFKIAILKLLNRMQENRQAI